VHDFVGRGGEDIFDPGLHTPFIQIATSSMSHRVIAAPTFDGHGISNNKTVTTRPPRAVGLHVGVTGFEVNCNLLGCG
jgi:hypothetical protein